LSSFSPFSKFLKSGHFDSFEFIFSTLQASKEWTFRAPELDGHRLVKSSVDRRPITIIPALQRERSASTIFFSEVEKVCVSAVQSPSCQILLVLMEQLLSYLHSKLASSDLTKYQYKFSTSSKERYIQETSIWCFEDTIQLLVFLQWWRVVHLNLARILLPHFEAMLLDSSTLRVRGWICWFSKWRYFHHNIFAAEHPATL
jgi:hypothetical protein